MNQATVPAATFKPADRRPPYVRWTFYLLCVCLVLLAGVSVALVALFLRGGLSSPSGRAGGVSGELRRDLAGKLLSVGLTAQAVDQYARYLSEVDLPPARRANLAYTIGKLCMDLGRFEDALAWLYQVDLLDPKSDLTAEAGAKIVACLERLGRFAQAQYSLDARSRLDKDGGQEFQGGEVVALLGQDAITLKDLNEAIDALPEWMRESLRDPAQKEAFLQQYVAEELLYRKARRLEMDKDPALRQQAERALRQLLVQKLLEEEIREKVKVTAADVELYFKANPEKYRERGAFRIRMIKTDPGRVREVQAELQKGADFAELAKTTSMDEATRAQGGRVEAWIEEGMDPTGLGDPARLWETLTGCGEGAVCGPLETDKAAFLFRVESRRPARSPALEEVKARVEQDLSRERMEKAYQQLVEESLKASDVKLFPEVLQQADAAGGLAAQPSPAAPGPATPGTSAGGPSSEPAAGTGEATSR